MLRVNKTCRHTEQTKATPNSLHWRSFTAFLPIVLSVLQLHVSICKAEGFGLYEYPEENTAQSRHALPPINMDPKGDCYWSCGEDTEKENFCRATLVENGVILTEKTERLETNRKCSRSTCDALFAHEFGSRCSTYVHTGTEEEENKTEDWVNEITQELDEFSSSFANLNSEVSPNYISIAMDIKESSDLYEDQTWDSLEQKKTNELLKEIENFDSVDSDELFKEQSWEKMESEITKELFNESADLDIADSDQLLENQKWEDLESRIINDLFEEDVMKEFE